MLNASGVSAGYNGNAVIHDITLEVPPGRVTALVGPNGSGKSTFVRACTGVIPLMAGTVTVGERAIAELSARERAHAIAVVAQTPVLPTGFSAGEVVLFGRAGHLRLWEQESSRDYDVARWAMNMTGVLDLANRPVQELSGGEQQRVVVARALAQEAPVLLLDEPTAHLDITRQAEVLALVRRLAETEGKAVLAIVHDLTLAAAYADDVVVLSQGKVLAAGPPGDVLNEELIRVAYGTAARVIRDPASGAPVVLPPLP